MEAYLSLIDVVSHQLWTVKGDYQGQYNGYHGAARHTFQLPFTELADVFGAKIVTVVLSNRHHIVL